MRPAGVALPERPLQSNYAHLRRLYHPHNYQGAWTPEDDDRLLTYVRAAAIARIGVRACASESYAYRVEPRTRRARSLEGRNGATGAAR